jgi:Ca2+-binding RTX toxin-like protein
MAFCNALRRAGRVPGARRGSQPHAGPRLRLVFESLEERALLAVHPLSEAPALHSNPAAEVKLFLDFNGHAPVDFFGDNGLGSAGIDNACGEWYDTEADTGTPAFDQDGDNRTFSDDELASIHEIWARVAEDFAPFNIDVTTENPGDCSDGTGVRVAIGGSPQDWHGEDHSGLAYLNAFTGAAPNIVYVFDRNWAGLTWRYNRKIADTASHETGHAFGLEHQVTLDANLQFVQEYSTNGDSPLKAPIMGNPYQAARSLWWEGPAYNAERSTQDDMAIIARADNGFRYRGDDHGDAAGGADQLDVAWNPLWGGTFTGSGIIEKTSDIDYFRFQTYARGEVTAVVNVAAWGPNLDAALELRDRAGGLLARAATAEALDESLTMVLDPGEYRLVVRSQGGYGDVGQYTVNVFVPDEILFRHSTGELTLTGDWRNDQITIEKIGENWQATVNDVVATFAVADVRSITINAGAGRDAINVRHSLANVPVTVNAGGGNDTINIGNGNSLDSIGGFITVRGEGDQDTLNLNDQSNPGVLVNNVAAGYEYEISNIAVSRTGSILLVYDTLESLVLNASRGNDRIVVQGLLGTAAITVNAGSGSADELVGADRSNTWNLTGANAGNLAGNIAFTSVENLTGGTGADTFVFAVGGAASGTINGRSGSDTLDYGAYAASVAVRLSTEQASATGGVRNIENVLGSPQNDVLIGDSSANILRGGAGRDLIIGRAGLDQLYGDTGEDILIGGSTAHDNNDLALLSILAEWGRGDQTYAQRIDHLANGGGRNGDVRLRRVEITEDASADRLYGGNLALDWFFASTLDSLPDRTAQETCDLILYLDILPPNSPRNALPPPLPL